MITYVPVLDEDVSQALKREVEKFFQFEHGSDLQAVTREILHHRELNHYLLTALHEHTGVRLGTMKYYDDIDVHVPYGLTIDFALGPPRRTALFKYDQYGGIKDGLRLLRSFPTHFHNETSDVYRYEGVPTPASLIRSVKEIFTSGSINEHVISLPPR